MSKFFKLFVIVITLFCISVPCVYADGNADFMETGKYVSCGGEGDLALVKNIPSKIPGITKMVYNAFMIVTPTILVIMGSIDLFRGIMSSKEDEIKKGRDTFLRRLIASVIVFLIVLGVKLIVGLVAGSSDNSTKIIGCINCFVSGSCNPEYTIKDEDDKSDSSTNSSVNLQSN